MDELEKFYMEKRKNIKNLGKNSKAKQIGLDFIIMTRPYKYSSNYTWLGRPIIQHPQDILAMQEIIWDVKPDIIIETGIAHGGSIIFYASLLELTGKGQVIGIDIEIRPYNRELIENHPMYKRITMLEGDSTSLEIIKQVGKLCESKEIILVCLDSDHSHKHVLKELELYSQFVTVGSYLIVFDTLIEDLPEYLFNDRPWGKGNNPKTAVCEFLKHNDNFNIVKDIDDKLIISAAPGGYLKRIK